MRNWNLSLRYKFLLIIASVLMLATLSYLGLAIQLFNTDKKAYIYDNNAALVETIGEEVSTSLLGSLRVMRLAALAATAAGDEASRTLAVQTLLNDDESFVSLSVSKQDPTQTQGRGELLTPLATAHSTSYLASYNLESTFLDQIVTTYPWPLALIKDKGLYLYNAALSTGPALLGVAVAIPAQGDQDKEKSWIIATAFLRQDRRFTSFQRSTLYQSYLLDGHGNILVHSDPALVSRHVNVGKDKAVGDILSAPLAKGVFEVEGRIIAYKKLGLGDLIAVSEIPTEKAFVASRLLVEKSAWFAVLILSLAFLISILFAKRLTAALQTLYQATLKIARGEFDLKLAIESKDEVGALSRSFNTMAKEISRLLVETADKARMEKELETAQLVQDNFFPKGDFAFGSFQVSSFFKPASECGGDWWGSLRLGDKLVVLIGDATGHGVPAALITAAAHSCAMTLSHLSSRMPQLSLTPTFILDCLNAAICQAGQGRVKMTFFVGVLDRISGELAYANASHDTPVIYRGSAQSDPTAEASREHLDALEQRPDPCLGESLETRYHEHKTVLEPRDTLLLFTDGLIEGRNADNEEFGERRLLRILVEVAKTPAVAIKEQLITRAQSFFGKPTQEDDITLVVIKHAG